MCSLFTIPTLFLVSVKSPEAAPPAYGWGKAADGELPAPVCVEIKDETENAEETLEVRVYTHCPS